MQPIKKTKNNKAKVLFTGSALILNLHSCYFLKQLSEAAQKSDEASKSSSQSTSFLNQEKSFSDARDLTSTLASEEATNKAKTGFEYTNFYKKKQETTSSNVEALSYIKHSPSVHSSYRNSEYNKNTIDVEHDFISNSDADDHVVAGQTSVITLLNNSTKAAQVDPKCDDNQDNNSEKVNNYGKINNIQASQEIIYNEPSEESKMNSEYEEEHIYDQPFEIEVENNLIDNEAEDTPKKNKIASENFRLDEGKCEEHIYEEIYEEIDQSKHVYSNVDSLKFKAKLDNNNNHIGVTIIKNGQLVTDL